MITASDVQAREAARLLEELGDEAPDRPLQARELRTLRYEEARGELLSGSTCSVRLGDDLRLFACDLRKLGDRILPGTADPMPVDPPWAARLGPELAHATARLLRPDGILACHTGVYYLPYSWAISRWRDCATSGRSPRSTGSGRSATPGS